jgi:hypothetical protein
MNNKMLVIGLYDLLWASGNWKKALELCRKNGATAIRLFYMISWGFENPMQPYCKIRTWNTGFGNNLPFYDLTIHNPSYWQRFREVHTYMKELGLEAHGVLHDGCSIRANPDMYPFIANVQKVDPDTYASRTLGGIYGLPASWQGESEAMFCWHREWFEKVATELNNLDIDYKLEIINEGDTIHSTDPMSGFIKWHQWCVTTLNDLGIAKDRIITSAQEREIIEWSRQVGIYGFHGVVRPEKLPLPSNRLPSGYDSRCKILISGDGGWDGDAEPFYLDYRNCSPEQAKKIAEKVIEYDYLGYEYTAHESCGGLGSFANLGENGERVNYEALRACGEVFGTIPMPPQPPSPIPPPTPPKPPIRPCSYYFKRFNFKRWWRCIWR